MVGETMWFTIFVAWYTSSLTGGLIKIGILNDLRNRSTLDLLSHCRAWFETGIPSGIHDSRSKIGFRDHGSYTTTTTAATINLDVMGFLAQCIDGRNT